MKLLFIKSLVKTLVFIILVILTDLSFSPGSHRELRGVVLYFMWRESVLGSISFFFFLSWESGFVTMGERDKKIRIVIQVCSQGDQHNEERKYTFGPFQRLFKHFSIKLPVLDLFIQPREKAPCFNIYALCTLQPRSFIIHSSVSNPGNNKICRCRAPVLFSLMAVRQSLNHNLYF